MENSSSSLGSPITSLEKAPSTDEEYLQLADSVWEYVRGSRAGLEYRIRESLHFLLGDQWIRYLPHAQQFTHHNLDEWVPTPVTNYLVKHYDRIVDIFTSGNALPQVSPAGEDQSDIEAAYAAERMLHSEWRRLKSKTNLLIPAAGWMVLTGNAILYSAWNGRAGTKGRKPIMKLEDREASEAARICLNCDKTFALAQAPGENCPSCGGILADTQVQPLDEYGNPQRELREEQETDANGQLRYRSTRHGDVVESCVNLLNFYPGPARSFDKLRFAIETDPMDLDEIKNLYGKKAEEIVAESIELEEWQGTYNTQLEGHSGIENEKPQDRVLHKWVRHVPNKLFPKGLLLCVANGVLLYQGPLDSPDELLPYTLLKYREVPGFFWGASVFADLIPQQKRLNSIDSHLVTNRKKMANSQWLIPEGSGISEVTGQSGLLIRYNPHTTGGFKPELVPPIPVPQQVVIEREQTLRDMEDVSGAREVLSGDVPPGPETGAAIEHLIEQAFKRFGPSVEMWRQGFADHVHRNLKIISKHWRQKRQIKVIGHNKETELYHYSRADIDGAVDMYIRMQLGSQHSETARQQKVMKAAEMGLLGDIRMPEIRGKVLEKLEIEGFESEYINDAKKARRVLRAIIRGVEAEPALPGVDNDAVQFSILKDYLLSAEYSQLSEEKQQALIQRAMQHQQALQQIQQQQMQAAQAAKGAPDQVADAMAQSGALQGQAPQGVA
jgi:hypothetical protein